MSFSVKKTGGRMWHEARKQEKKIRGMLVDYRRRAERRRDYYEKIVRVDRRERVVRDGISLRAVRNGSGGPHFFFLRKIRVSHCSSVNLRRLAPSPLLSSTFKI